jgi:hypothetical protein
MTADNAILSTLVAERIALSMEALDRGETTTFMLALPLHGIMAEMSLVKVQNETINGVSCAIIKLAPSNLLFRVLMGDPSYFFFERAKPYRLIQYKGIVGLPSPEGKQQRGLAQMIYVKRLKVAQRQEGTLPMSVFYAQRLTQIGIVSPLLPLLNSSLKIMIM